MNSKVAAFVGLVFAGLVLAAAVLVPRFEAPRSGLQREVVEQVEKARRILTGYEPALDLDADIRSASEAELVLDAEKINTLLAGETPPTDEAAEALREYAEIPGVRSLAAAVSPPPPSRISDRMFEEGRRQYEQQLAANDRRLDQAIAEVQNALGQTKGDFSARQNPNANRLLGILQYLKGIDIARRVAWMRAELAADRFALKQTGLQLTAMGAAPELVEVSEIETRIREAESDVQSLRAALAEQEQHVADLTGQVNALRTRAEQARQRSDAAREAMETLQDLGVDLSDPQGFEGFRSAFVEQANAYRDAIAEAHIAQWGNLQNAVIDYTGDYVAGSYEPSSPGAEIVPRPGLLHLEQDLDSASAVLELMQVEMVELDGILHTFRELRDTLQSRAAIATAFIQEKRQQLGPRLSEFGAASDATRQAEDEAIAWFEKASKSFQAAIRGVAEQEAYISERQPQNPELQQLHPSHLSGRGKQKWVTGHLAAQDAESQVRIALLHLGRHQDAAANLADLGDLADEAEMSDLKNQWAELAGSAREAGLASLQSAEDLLDNKAQNDIGQGNWSVAAEIAAAHYLMSLLDVEMAAEKAIAWYDAALEGREDDPNAAPHVFLRDYIRHRLGG